jgi:hypothetical protein
MKQILASGLWHGVQQLQGPRVWAVIELVQGLFEQHPVTAIRGCLSEKGETGPKLEIIGRAENFQRRFVFVPHDEPNIPTQAAT